MCTTCQTDFPQPRDALPAMLRNKFPDEFGVSMKPFQTVAAFSAGPQLNCLEKGPFGFAGTGSLHDRMLPTA
jgi:hypothetical protein